jgi:hypothetical protein
MARRRTRWLFVVVVSVAVSAAAVDWHLYTVYAKAKFLRGLHLVGFSTSLIGTPHAETERAAQEKAEHLNINLFEAYKHYLAEDVRFDLAWMLITRESLDYYEFAKSNIDSVPWPEVRIWRDRCKEHSLSREYRDRLLDLLLASPTSEAKLFAGHWYEEQGKTEESEGALHAAMNNGLFWDALDAADLLVDSERYHDDAVNHLLAVVRDAEYFTPRAAFSIAELYRVREELQPLVESCCDEPPNGPNRKKLVARLQQLVGEEPGSLKAATEDAP